jgi:hypothetical protein
MEIGNWKLEIGPSAQAAAQAQAQAQAQAARQQAARLGAWRWFCDPVPVTSPHFVALATAPWPPAPLPPRPSPPPATSHGGRRQHLVLHLELWLRQIPGDRARSQIPGKRLNSLDRPYKNRVKAGPWGPFLNGLAIPQTAAAAMCHRTDRVVSLSAC